MVCERQLHSQTLHPAGTLFGSQGLSPFPAAPPLNCFPSPPTPPLLPSFVCRKSLPWLPVGVLGTHCVCPPGGHLHSNKQSSGLTWSLQPPQCPALRLASRKRLIQSWGSDEEQEAGEAPLSLRVGLKQRAAQRRGIPQQPICQSVSPLPKQTPFFGPQFAGLQNGNVGTALRAARGGSKAPTLREGTPVVGAGCMLGLSRGCGRPRMGRKG